MKTILYQRDDDKILVSELVVNKEQFIKYNESKIKQLYIQDLSNTTSNLIYNIVKEYDEPNKFSLEKYHKIYSNRTICAAGSVTYLIPAINKKSASIYDKFSHYGNSLRFVTYHSEKLPEFDDIKDCYKNYKFNDALFYFPTTYQAIKLDKELELLYKLLYIRNFDFEQKGEINTDEFKKIFTLNFKEVLSYSTYMDILSPYYTVMNESVEQTINDSLEKDSEKIKKIKLILK